MAPFDLERRVFDRELLPWEIDLTCLRPLGNGIVIERIPQNEFVVLTDTVPPHRGRVIRTGPRCTVKAGEIVRYSSCDIDSGTHVLLKEGDILFVEN